MRGPLHHDIDRVVVQERAQRVGRCPVACAPIRSKEQICRNTRRAGKAARTRATMASPSVGA